MAYSTLAEPGVELLEESSFSDGDSISRWSGTIRLSERWSAYINAPTGSPSNLILRDSGRGVTLRWGQTTKSVRIYQPVDIVALQAKGGSFSLQVRIEGPDAAELMPSIKAIRVQRVTGSGGDTICDFNNFVATAKQGRSILTARAALPSVNPDEQHRLTIEFRVAVGKATISSVSLMALPAGVERVIAVKPEAAKKPVPAAPTSVVATLQTRSSRKPSLAIVTWDLAHNPAGRALTLAELAKPSFDVEIVGPVFPRFGTDVWAPIDKSVDIPIVALRASSFDDLYDQALELSLAKQYDLVCLCKPRLPAVIIGTLLAARSGANVFVDFDEDELAFFNYLEELDVGSAIEASRAADAEDAHLPFGKAWTGAAVRMARGFPATTVSNETLQTRFGGLILRHARNETLFRPDESVRRAARVDLGVSDEDRVLLFIGTPRLHKGILEIARAMDEIDDPRLILVIVGTISDKSLESGLRRLKRARVRLLPDQPWSRLSQLIQGGDAVPVLLNTMRPITATQMPAKVTDALACGLRIIASPTPPLQGLIARQLATGVSNYEELKAALRELANAPASGAAERRAEFLGEYSHAVNAARLRLAAELAADGQSAKAVRENLDGLIKIAEARKVRSDILDRLKDVKSADESVDKVVSFPRRAAAPRGDRLPSINWVIGPDSNIEWAYGNNAKRLAACLPSWDHQLAGSSQTDVALYFDAIVAQRYPQDSLGKVLRVGGARPLDRLYGDDPDKLREGLEPFDAVITLSAQLQRRVSAVHSNVWLIPNGLDLSVWSPDRLTRAKRPFTAGFAASAASSAERKVKGLDFVIEATSLTDVPLRRVHKGVDQIRNADMISEFYSNIDVLVHPVAAGREGCSNVIMEALSLGIPVITTENAGYHSEMLRDEQDVLFCRQDAEDIALALSRLREDPELAERLSANGRRFAERHHDINAIARQYAEIFRATLADAGRAARDHTVAFEPFWKPAPKFASSRLRGERPKGIVSKHPAAAKTAPESRAAEIVVVIQSAETPDFERLRDDPGKFLIYDVCDRYFESAKIFKTPTGDVNSLERFGELIERANVVIAPTIELKAEIASRYPHRAVYYVPEALDYSGVYHPASPVSKQVVWFGSPQRGNFDSAKWLLDSLRVDLGYSVRLITRRSFFSRMPVYAGCAEDWEIDSFIDKLREASICVVTHAADEETKSPNRFVTAVGHGVPTIVSQSKPCEEMLRAAGCAWAIVNTPEELAAAARRLEDPTERANYLKAVQQAIEERHGDGVVRRTYQRLFDQLTYKAGQTPKNVVFVTHNLNFGEGAPKSLFELAVGLRALGAANPFVYCPSRGDLERLYQEQEISVSTYSPEFRPPMRTLNQKFSEIRESFQLYLKERRIDYVIANTIKSAPFAMFAKELGIPASIIIRESFAPEKRYDYYSDEAAAVAKRAMVAADNVIFVAENTMTMWANEPMSPSLRLIKNGVNTAPFAPAMARTREEAREALGLAGRDLIAVCVGTINERKGQRELAQWFASLPQAVKSRLTLVFVGATEGRGLQEFNDFAATLGASDRERLVIVPTTPEIGLYYRASDLFLMNSSQESYPRSTMEALLFGLPVIATPVFGVLEQIVDGENGFIYPANDGARWAERISEIVSDDALRAAMSKDASRSFWRLTTHAEMLHEYRCIIGRG